ncbi:MAG: YbgC/FadM family acyl-CoA thioesterase [Rhodospirillales bacterium]|nr:YbgC/FadM family acyl-CoA thioesterase [Rhodospirillales bacterium]
MGPLGGRFEGGEHVYPLRVYHEDTDAGGIVYYANYLKFAERARTEMMRGAGITHVTLLGDHDAAFVVSRCVVDYRQPALLDDEIEVRTTIDKVAGAHIEAEQRVVREEALLASIGLKLGCVGRNGRAVRLPAPLRKALAELVPAGRR